MVVSLLIVCERPKSWRSAYERNDPARYAHEHAIPEWIPEHGECLDTRPGMWPVERGGIPA